ncbi:hypothetical protein DB30_01268 [Enhygromyxa salina]|uniref:Uncharacterized protein n=1 Tax=Enhygromyxa salina TaxID=215803 RepID=A0A0C1ZN93_9BACT|nr:hypothetical protein [Enhygromyxa salina]KIG12558.1 hypothetical protein DB30_01268 [Enhygromyxa salina]
MLVLDRDGALTEALPMAHPHRSRVFQRSISRKLGEPWPAFVARAGVEAKALPGELRQEFEDAVNELALPAPHQIWYRLTWNSEPEWERNRGLNLIELERGNPGDPRVGRDANGVRYLFHHDHNDTTLGRHLFDHAEQLCADLERVRGPLIEFVRAQQDHAKPTLEAFTLRDTGEPAFEVTAYLRNADASGYWAVRLEDFAPVECGLVSAIPG